MIASNRGNSMLMLNGHTYSQKKHTKYYVCSKSNSRRCRAKVKLNDDGTVVGGNFEHSHPPPKYIFKSAVQYKMISSNRGNSMLMIDGHTYSRKKYTKYYVCSKAKSQRCYAKVKLNDDGTVMDGNYDHTHPPPKYVITSSGNYIKVDK